LAAWVTTETIIFWEIIWRTRDVLPDDSPELFGGFAITALYYFAAALVFPDYLANRKTLDGYFMKEKARVIAAILLATALAFTFRPAVMGWTSWDLMPWYAWASLAVIYVVAPVAALTRRREVAIGCMAVLVVLDLL